jgi:hypothetical protein
MVSVEYPDSENSSYSSYWEEIQLKPEDGFRDGTICHEYGHHLQEEISENDIYTGDPSHTTCSDKDDTEFSWKEGFAEYYGTIVPHHHQLPDPKYLFHPNVSESDAENQCNCSTSNDEVESTILAVLWDLVDKFDSSKTAEFPYSKDESFDTISGKEALIFAIFDTYCDTGWTDAPDIGDFLTGLSATLTGSERNAIPPLLGWYGVSFNWQP